MKPKRILFYPCAGPDIQTPVAAFSAIVDEFWFVDVSIYQSRIPRLPGVRIDDIESTSWTLEGTGYPVTTQRYQRPKFNKTLSLNFVTGDGKTAFDQLFSDTQNERELSIFFHRGDSTGEGGSNVYWLDDLYSDGRRSGLLKLVLTKMKCPGLICTDGSNAIKELQTYFNFNGQKPTPDNHIELPFLDMHNHTLTPIGALDDSNGPTIVYQITRP